MNDTFKKLYARYRETIHIAGFVILLSFSVGGYWTKWQAMGAELDTHELRISKLEYQSGQVLQSLEDIKYYLHIPPRK